MSTWCSQASPRSISAKASTSVTLPSRIDFTSEPARTRPASMTSSTWYSWRARRLRARTFTSSAVLFLSLSLPRAAIGGREAYANARPASHGSGQGQDVDRGGAGPAQGFGAGGECGAGGEDVVDQQ